MKAEILLSPRFTGERFSAHTLPLALVKDLEALQGIIVEIARAEFIAANPNRRRLPRGFGDALTLHLVGTEPGSFIAHVALLVTATGLPGLAPEFTAARSACNTFMDAVHHAQYDGGPAPTLPEAAWPYVERFGRGLRDGEAIDLGSRNGRQTELTKEVRRRLLLTRAGVQVVTDEVQLAVRLGDVRPKERTITLELSDHRSVVATLTPQQLQELNDVRVGDFGATWLHVEGVGSFDRAQQLQRVDEVHSIELLESLDPRVQFEKLKLLPDGWLDGSRGSVLDHSLLDRVGAWLDEHLTEDAPLPRLYPTPEGGLEAEWLVGRIDLSIEFDPIAKTVEWHEMNLDTEEVDDRTLALDDVDGLSALGKAMVRVVTGRLGDNEEVAG